MTRWDGLARTTRSTRGGRDVHVPCRGTGLGAALTWGVDSLGSSTSCRRLARGPWSGRGLWGCAPLTTADGRVGNDRSLAPLVGTGDGVGALVHAVGPAVEGDQADAARQLRPRRTRDIP